MKIAILGSSGHYAMAFARPETGAQHNWAYCPTDPEEETPEGFRARNLPATLGAALQGYPDPADLLDRFQPDIAVVNPPFHRTAALTHLCLARGIPVLAEKPVALTWEDFRALERHSAAGGAPWMTMLTMRYEGIYSAAHRLVNQGGLGRVVTMNAQKSYPLRGWTQPKRPAFYHSRSTYGGTLPWIGIHLADLFSWYAQSPVRRITAQHTRVGNGGHGELESAAVLQLVFDSGALALGHMDFLKPQSVPGQPWGDDRLRLVGEQGTLEIVNGKGVLTSPTETTDLVPDPPADLFTGFLDWVFHGKPMRMSHQDCLQAIRLALLARDAADTCRSVEVT